MNEIFDMLAVIVSFFAVLVSTILSVFLYNKQNNFLKKRVLQDYFIKETKQLKADCIFFMEMTISHNPDFTAKDFMIKYKNFSVHLSNLLSFLNQEYQIYSNLPRILIEFNTIVTNDDDFSIHFNKNEKVSISRLNEPHISTCIRSIDKAFTQTIIDINSYSK